MNTKEKGDISVGKAISYFLSNGYEVCLPIGDKRHYDMLVEKDGKILRVQCKGCYNKNKQVGLRTAGYYSGGYRATKYPADAFDILWVTHEESSYIIPFSFILNKPSIQISEKLNAFIV